MSVLVDLYLLVVLASWCLISGVMIRELLASTTAGRVTLFGCGTLISAYLTWVSYEQAVAAVS